MATSINYSSTSQSGKNLSKSVTAVNPNAKDAQIKTFTQMLNGLTTNTLGSINRIDKNEISTTDTYYEPVITFSKDGDSGNVVTIDGTTITASNAALPNTYDMEQMITINVTVKANNVQFVPQSFSVDKPMDGIAVIGDSAAGMSIIMAQSSRPTTCTITIPEGSVNGFYYESSTITVNITA